MLVCHDNPARNHRGMPSQTCPSTGVGRLVIMPNRQAACSNSFVDIIATADIPANKPRVQSPAGLCPDRIHFAARPAQDGY